MVELRCSNLLAWVLPEYGMNTVRLSWNGEEILRPLSDEEDWKQACLYGVPLLLPPNRTEDGRFTFEDVTYQLPVNEEINNNHLHGFLRTASFTVTEQGEDHVSGVYENRGEIFPFPFRIRVDCRLCQSGYRQEFSIENVGTKNMPLTFGLHTNFAEKDSFSVPLDRCCLTNARHIPTGELAELDSRQRQYCLGMKADGESVEGFYTSAGHVARIGNMEYAVSENFDHWILFNRDGKQGFVCIEPQCGGVNVLNSKMGLRVLAPGEEEVFYTCIRPV